MANLESLRRMQKAYGAAFDHAESGPPLHYGDVLAEYRAGSVATALFDISGRSVIEIGGSDRAEWLQGMVSNDVIPLRQPGPRVRACVLDPTGHILADLDMVSNSDAILATCEPSCTSDLLQHLDQFIIAEDVWLRDVSDLYVCLALNWPQNASKLPVDPHLVVAAGSVPAPGAPAAQSWVLVTHVDGAAAAWQQLVEAGAAPIGSLAEQALRIEAGVPVFGIDMWRSTLPLEAGLLSTHISQSKGCYVGQEIVARIISRGHTNRALCRLTTGSMLEPGELLLSPDAADQREIGKVTSVAQLPQGGQTVALGYLRIEFCTSGTHILSAGGVPVTVANPQSAGSTTSAIN